MTGGTHVRSQALLRGSRRQSIPVAANPLVRAHVAPDSPNLPLVVEPLVSECDPVAWAGANLEWIETAVLRHGAVLFRNFPIDNADGFRQFVRAIAGEPIDYRFRASPRREVAAGVYTSTEYRADQSIFPHNEHAYSPVLPLRLFFYCATPPESGGQTPIGDCRTILGRIDPRVRERFVARGITYVRNYGDGFGLPWETVFQTTERGDVERYCQEHGIEFTWKHDGRLRTRQSGPAVVRHPASGEASWCNHATFFHVSTLAPAIRDHLLATFAVEDLPNNTYYGDGSPIEPAVLEQLRDAYRHAMVVFRWERGDVLMLDNILTAHARQPYSGRREILVAMAQPVRQVDLAPAHPR